MRLRYLLPLLFAPLLQAQTPANTVPVCAEDCVVISSSNTAAVFEFGANGKFNTITKPTYPLVVNCTLPCPQLGGDPLPGTGKTIYAVEQAASYTVTYQNSSGQTQPPVTVPALPAPPVTISKQWSCAANTAVLFSLMSDGTFTVSGPVTCKETK